MHRTESHYGWLGSIIIGDLDHRDLSGVCITVRRILLLPIYLYTWYRCAVGSRAKTKRGLPSGAMVLNLSKTASK